MANPPQSPLSWGASATPPPPGGTASAGGAPATHVPAPTIDVQVRTMESDLASLAASGGNTVAAETIALQVRQNAAAAAGGDTHHAVKAVFVGIVSVIVLAALVFGGYALYRRLVQNPVTSSTAPDVPSVSQDDAPPSATAAILIKELPGAHASFLKQPAASRAALVLSTTPVSDPSLVRTYSQTLRDTLKGVTAANAELEVQSSVGTPLTFVGFLDTINAPLIDVGVYQENFEPDFTFFVIKQEQVFQAAYILKLREGKNWLFVKNDVAKLETAPGLETLFPNAPGVRDPSFQDETLAEQPVRTLRYTNPEGKFIYGWFRDHLILATSPAALEAALAKLCFLAGSC